MKQINATTLALALLFVGCDTVSSLTGDGEETGGSGSSGGESAEREETPEEREARLAQEKKAEEERQALIAQGAREITFEEEDMTCAGNRNQLRIDYPDGSSMNSGAGSTELLLPGTKVLLCPWESTCNTDSPLYVVRKGGNSEGDVVKVPCDPMPSEPD